MASQADVRRIALSLPETTEEGGFHFSVAGKGFAWPWLERLDPKRARVPNPDVIGVRVANELEKQALLSLDPSVFFTEPDYDGYPAVLVRLPAIDPWTARKGPHRCLAVSRPEEARSNDSWLGASAGYAPGASNRAGCSIPAASDAPCA